MWNFHHYLVFDQYNPRSFSVSIVRPPLNLMATHRVGLLITDEHCFRLSYTCPRSVAHIRPTGRRFRSTEITAPAEWTRLNDGTHITALTIAIIYRPDGSHAVKRYTLRRWQFGETISDLCACGDDYRRYRRPCTAHERQSVTSYSCTVTLRLLVFEPPPSTRHHLSYDDCLAEEEKLSELFCAVLCTTAVHSDTPTHMCSSKVECWF